MSEFDCETVKLDIGGSGYETYQMAVFTPAKSGYSYAMLFKAQDTAAFQQTRTEFIDHYNTTRAISR